MKRNQVIALLSVSVLGGLMPLLPPLKKLEEASVDARFNLRPPLQNKSRVVVVAIDNPTEQSWHEIPRGLWGGKLAQILTKINQAGASRVALDLILGVDSDPYLAKLGVHATPNQDLDNALSELGVRALLGTFTGNDIISQLRAATDGRELVSVNTTQTKGGVIRQVPRVDRFLNPPLPGLAARLAQAPADNDRPIEINYSGNPRSNVISALDLLQNHAPSDMLKGALVLVGETNSLSEDVQDTPFGRVPGVLIQAEAVRTLMENRELKTTSVALEIVLGAVLGALFGVLAIRSTAGRYLVGALVFSVAWSLLAVELFSSLNVVLPWFSPVSVALLWTPLALFPVKIADERRERLWARAQWGQMVSDRFVSVLEKNRNSGMGAMGTFNAALLFLDVANFSARSNELAPDALLTGLNRVLAEAVQDIQTHGGTVLNFMGDGLSAMFTQEPGELPTKALEAALASALQIRQNAIWDVRLGLAFGEVTLALVGSETRKQMTVYGPAVNMASRLEQAGKELGSGLVLSADYASAPRAKTLDLAQSDYCPKGWSEPIQVLYVALPAAVESDLR